MTTLPLRAPQTLPLPGLARLIAMVLTALDVFTEAQAKARAAHQQYPFADW